MMIESVFTIQWWRIETLANKSRHLNEQREKRMKHWLDSEEIAKYWRRRFRYTGTTDHPYSQIGHNLTDPQT